MPAPTTARVDVAGANYVVCAPAKLEEGASDRSAHPDRTATKRPPLWGTSPWFITW